jgi:hypothetical protein
MTQTNGIEIQKSLFGYFNKKINNLKLFQLWDT